MHSSRMAEIPRRVLKAVSTPQWLTLLTVFLVLYGPFVFRYGWEYLDTPKLDLPSFYAASVCAFEHGESPYDLEKLRLSIQDVLRVHPYLYPPPSLLVFFPLSLLSYEDARHVVLLTSHLVFLILVWAIPWRLLRARPRYDLRVFVLCIVYSITFYPVFVTLNNGQVNLLLLAFLVLFWLLARNGNAPLAALFLALCVLLKTYALLIIPMLLLIGRWREGIYASIWLGLATLMSFFILPNTLWHDWLTNVLPTGGYIHTPHGLFSPAAVWNQSLNGFFARAFTDNEWSSPIIVNNPSLARILTYGGAGLIATATAVAAWRGRVRADSLDRTMLVTLPAMYLVAPLSWEHHLVYLLPVILLLLDSRYSSSLVPRAIFYLLCFASAVLVNAPGLLPFKFCGVVVLWGLALFAASSTNVRFAAQFRDCGQSEEDLPGRDSSRNVAVGSYWPS